ncbi:MAG: ATP-binding protein, partial [Actinomycetota bacterium]|nr:ATP-binding protein [Actinomycetota bacterium]
RTLAGIADEGFVMATGSVGELFWNIDDGVLVCRPGRVLAWNPAAEAILGLTSDEATAGADLRVAFGDALDRLWELVAAGSGQARLECRGGSERVLQARAWQLGGVSTAPTAVVVRDVTDEERKLDGLRRLNAMARELLAAPSLDDVLVPIVDAAKELARAQYSLLLLLREDRPDEVAKFVYNAPRELFPERLPRVVGLLAEPVATRSVARIDDIRGHSAGVGIPVEHPPIAALLAVPVLVGEAVVGELVVANSPGQRGFDEVDEAMMGELASHAAVAVSLSKARAAHEHLDETRQALLDVALHDLRSPLTIARGFVSTIKASGADMSDEDRAGAFEAVEQALDRVQELAEGVLLDEQQEPGPGGLARAGPIDVPDLLRELKADLAPLRPDVALDVTLEGCCPPLPGDRRMVRELLDNLVTNAIKHSPPGELVTVTARLEGSSVRFDVSDRGPGIPPEEQGRVFEQFYRTQRSVAEGTPGSGLGLWIAGRLAELQGGVVGVTSRSGQGSTFWVTLPLE